MSSTDKPAFDRRAKNSFALWFRATRAKNVYPWHCLRRREIKMVIRMNVKSEKKEKYENCTFCIMRGVPKSAPPWSLKPHGVWPWRFILICIDFDMFAVDDVSSPIDTTFTLTQKSPKGQNYRVRLEKRTNSHRLERERRETAAVEATKIGWQCICECEEDTLKPR